MDFSSESGAPFWLASSDQTMGRRIVNWLLHPAENFQFREAAGNAILVRLSGSVLEVLQKFVGVPLLGVVVLDIALFDKAGHNDPLIAGLRSDNEADECRVRVADGVAERPQHPCAFGLGDEEMAVRKFKDGLI